MGTDKDKIFPENWKEIIRDKKVIFYNTSLGSLLQGRERHIVKMQWVFEIFQKHPEVVLWWRPHPLEFSTICSMHPELAQMYDKVKGMYKQKRMGILDESADLHRAIAVSDAYYGDMSSVEWLYRATGKPVLQANDTICDEVTYDRSLQVMDFTYCNGLIWFVSLIYNYLFALDVEHRCVTDMIRIPVESPLSAFSIRHIFSIDNELFLVRAKGDGIIKYHIENGIFTRMPMSGHMFSRFTSIDCEDASKLYGVTGRDNLIYKYDLRTNTYTEVEVGSKQNKYIGIKKLDHDNFILIQICQPRITLWNEKNGEEKEISGFPEGFRVEFPEMPFTEMITMGHNILVFPQYANMILQIDIENNEITQLADNYEKYRYDNGMIYSCAKKIGHTIIAFAQYTEKWIKYDPAHRNVEELDIDLTEKQWEELQNNSLFDCETEGGLGFREGENRYLFTLHRFISDLKAGIEYGKRNNSEYKCGSKIYKTIVNGLEENNE